MRLTVTKRSAHCTGTAREVVKVIEVTRLELHNVGSNGVTLDLTRGTLNIPIYHRVTPTYLALAPSEGTYHVVGPSGQ